MTETIQDGRWSPLTPAQFDFWEEFIFHPYQPVSTVAHRITLRGAVNEAALAAALRQVIEETDVFSIQFHRADRHADPVQRCDPAHVPPLRTIDLRQRASAQAVADAMMQGDIDGQLNLLRQPLAAVWLICLAADRYIIYIRAHHIIVDGFGMALIEHRCAELYRAACGQAAPGQPFGSFSAFLHEERQYAQGEKMCRDRAYWHHLLAGAPPLPVLRKGGEDYGAAGLHGEAQLSPPFSSGLMALAERSDVGWPDALLALSAAWMALRLPEALRGDVLPVWVPVMNRRGAVAANTPALAVNILPLFIRFKKREPVVEYVQRLAKSLHDLRLHGRYRVETLAAERGIGKGMRYFFSPLINVLPFDPPVFFRLRGGAGSAGQRAGRRL
jgi:enterobactin synthetase component F